MRFSQLLPGDLISLEKLLALVVSVTIDCDDTTMTLYSDRLKMMGDSSFVTWKFDNEKSISRSVKVFRDGKDVNHDG